MIRSKVGLILAMAGLASAAELKRPTLDAWQQYVRGANARMEARLAPDKPFLWIDESAGRKARVRRGEVVVEPMTGRGTESVPDGLIHDWIGAIFIPNTTIRDLQEVAHDYDRYKNIYKPVVMDSHLLAASAEEQEFSMTWQHHVLFVNAAIEGRYRARDFLVGPGRGYSIIEASRIQQIESYGHQGEHFLPPDTGSGFIWRMQSISRYEERDGGVYLEIEGIALSRDIPASLRWMVNPVVNHLSINSLATSLRQTRQAAQDQPQRVAMVKRTN